VGQQYTLFLYISKKNCFFVICRVYMFLYERAGFAWLQRWRPSTSRFLPWPRLRLKMATPLLQEGCAVELLNAQLQDEVNHKAHGSNGYCQSGVKLRGISDTTFIRPVGH